MPTYWGTPPNARRDVTIEDYKTLHLLMVQPYPTEATPARLAEAANVTRAAMTSRLDRLVAADLVARDVDASDRRRVLVRPTAAGRAAWDHYIYEGMAREQRLGQIDRLLRKVMLSIDE